MSASITMLRQGIRAERDQTSYLWTILNEMRLQRQLPEWAERAIDGTSQQADEISAHRKQVDTVLARMSKGLIARATSNGEPVSARLRTRWEVVMSDLSKAQASRPPLPVDGEVMERVELSRNEFDLFNHARSDMTQLRALLMDSVVPALGGGGHPVVTEIHDLIERIILCTGNFLYRYNQQIGAAYRERDL
ncbi:TPA: hypothetical protein NIE47_001624 [Pseudomonas aeruginosa]|nr:hypothetical protein [Pseudomonas aeruginosa]